MHSGHKGKEKKPSIERQEFKRDDQAAVSDVDAQQPRRNQSAR
jgi:hypothetical protein